MANIPTIDTVKLTAKGLRLLAKVQSGATMYFVRAAIGDGFMQDGQDGSRSTITPNRNNRNISYC